MKIHANMKTVHRNLAVLFMQMLSNIGKQLQCKPAAKVFKRD